MNYDTIRDELVQYDSRLGERPEILAVTKAELPGAGEVQGALAARTGKEVLLVSAVTGQGLNQLVQAIAKALETRELAAT